jgi:hypothetical protein
MIIVRTLTTVGGKRSGAKGTRKLNRFARAHGFHTFAAMKADFDLRMKGYLVE